MIAVLAYTMIVTLCVTIALSMPIVAKRLGVAPIFASSSLMLVTYLLYEVKMPDETNIRVDLFILWPLMTIALLMAVFRIVRLSRSQKR
jgi:hypothetical protein